MPVAATHEVASDIVASVAVTLKTVFEATPTISKPDIAIVAGLGTDTIPSPSVMMPGVATPPYSLTTGLVSSCEPIPNILSFCLFFASIFM